MTMTDDRPTKRRRDNAARRRQIAKRSKLRQWQLATWRRSELNACIHCTTQVRSVPALFPGRSRTKLVRISVKPSAWGEVYRSSDGRWVVLRPHAKRFAGVEFYRLHGYDSCSDEAEWVGDARPLAWLWRDVERALT